MKPLSLPKQPDNPRLCQLHIAFCTFKQVMYGSQSPEPIMVVLANWREKEEALREAGRKLNFDLVELARIEESARGTLRKAFPKSATSHCSVSRAAGFLRSGGQSVPHALILAGGGQPIEEAMRKHDVAFFIALGKELAREVDLQESAADNLKLFLGFYWEPRISGKAFWPGLAYMCNPARVHTFDLFRKVGGTDGDSLRKTWQQLGLIPAKKPFIRRVFRGTNDSVPTIDFA